MCVEILSRDMSVERILSWDLRRDIRIERFASRYVSQAMCVGWFPLWDLRRDIRVEIFIEIFASIFFRHGICVEILASGELRRYILLRYLRREVTVVKFASRDLLREIRVDICSRDLLRRPEICVERFPSRYFRQGLREHNWHATQGSQRSVGVAGGGGWGGGPPPDTDGQGIYEKTSGTWAQVRSAKT